MRCATSSACTRRPASERTLSFAIWGALLLYYVGVLPEIAQALDDARIPIGKGEVSVLDLGRDAIVIVVVIVLSLWASSLLEQRLLRAGISTAICESCWPRSSVRC